MASCSPPSALTGPRARSFSSAACVCAVRTGSLPRPEGRQAKWLSIGASPSQTIVDLSPHQSSPRKGLMKWVSAKSFPLSVTITQSLAPATAATIISSALRGRPAAFPSAMSHAHVNAALSSKGRMRPANSSCGPSGPENQASTHSALIGGATPSPGVDYAE